MIRAVDHKKPVFEMFDLALSSVDPILFGALNSSSDLLDFQKLPETDVLEACIACERIIGVYLRLSTELGVLSSDLIEMLGVSTAVVPLVRLDNGNRAINSIIRFDLIKTAVGYKIIEVNADGPGLIVAAFCLVPQLCKFAQATDIDLGGEDALRAVIESSLTSMWQLAEPPAEAVFSARGKDGGAHAQAYYLMGFASRLGIPVRVVPTESLQIVEDGLIDEAGKYVSCLYHTEPLDSFVGGLRSALGTESGEMLAKLVKTHRLFLVNSSTSHMWHSKAFQALIWRLYEDDIWLTHDERASVEQYMLPTYLHQAFSREKYVSKPAYGKRGDTVFVIDPATGICVDNGTRSYGGQRIVYQQYTAPTSVSLMSREGEMMLHTLLSVFVIGGRAVRLIARAGMGVTDDSWWVLPIALG